MPAVLPIAAVMSLAFAVPVEANEAAIEAASEAAEADYHVPPPPSRRLEALAPPLAVPEVRVRIGRPALAAAVREAVSGATQRLGRVRCSSIFSDFADGSGAPLQSRLDALGLSGAAYLGQMGFHDGQGLDRCEHGRALALTMPGSRVVWVCSAFTLLLKRDPGLAEVVVLHEALHSLGLGENPPTSLEVTAEVVKHCGR